MPGHRTRSETEFAGGAGTLDKPAGPYVNARGNSHSCTLRKSKDSAKERKGP